MTVTSCAAITTGRASFPAPLSSSTSNENGKRSDQDRGVDAGKGAGRRGYLGGERGSEERVETAERF